MLKILKWCEIEHEFQDVLIVGNGASVALHEEFNYDSLYEAAIDYEYITAQIQEVFNKFGINDFELVLKRLWQAKLVNDALNINSKNISRSYEEIRNALISTIRSVHITYDEVLPHLEPIYKFMKKFKIVLSLNYDLIVYWAAMYGNNILGNWFKDCFQSMEFDEDWNRFKEPYNAEGCTLFFYPHGNLVLIRKDFASIIKIDAIDNDNSLLDEILNCWVSGKYVPVFVCEGLTEHKMNSIYDANYLSRIYHEVLPDSKESLVIYGWKIADQDEHILDQIRRSDITRIAVSVNNNNQEFAEYADKKLRSINIKDIRLFDAASEGCWNNDYK